MDSAVYEVQVYVGQFVCVSYKHGTGTKSERVHLNLSIRDTFNTEHLSNEDTVFCPNHMDLCTDPPLN